MIKAKWQTWWTIAGPKLPNAEVRIANNVIIAPITGKEEQQALRAPQHNMSLDEMHVYHHPPRDIVTGLHRLQVDIESNDQENAIVLANETVQRLLISLTLAANGSSYFAEWRQIRKHGEQEVSSAWSPTLMVRSLAVAAPLGVDDLENVRHFFAKLQSNKIANIAYQHLQAARQLQDTSGSKPLAAPTLFQYVLSMEAVVDGIATDVRNHTADSIKRQRNEYAKDFLAKAGARANKAEAIIEAYRELGRINLQAKIPGIEKAGELLGLPTETIKSATDLYRFRSSNIGHPGRTDVKKIEKWIATQNQPDNVCKAERIVRAFLSAFCETYLP